MFIDTDVQPAFYRPINDDPRLEDFRHEHLNIRLNGTASLEHVLDQMQCAGLDKMFLLPEDYSSKLGRAIVTNEEIRKLVDLAPERFIGFAAADPHQPDASAKLEHAFSELKLAGLVIDPARLHLYPADEKLAPFYQLCETFDRPVIFRSGLSWAPDTLAKYGHPLAFEELALRHPALRFCLTQFGWPWIRETAMLMVKHKNVYASMGALYFDNAREFFDQCYTKDIPGTWIDRSLRHQVMFGSGNPRFEQIRMAEALGHLGLRESTLKLIKGENALDFLTGKDRAGRERFAY